MKLALISPISMLETTCRSNYQLVLPQLLIESSEYTNHYRQLGKEPNQYLILDNGANEGAELSWTQFMNLTALIDADEIVAPDVLGDWKQTVSRTIEFLKRYKNWQNAINQDLNIAIVAQGTTVAQAIATVDHIMVANAYSDVVTTIAIPRSLIESTGDKFARLDVALTIREHWPDMMIHLLGASSLFTSEVAVAAGNLGSSIRGMDTSMPYYFTLEDQHVAIPIKLINRVDHDAYFATPESNFLLGPDKHRPICRDELLEINIRQMLDWAANGSETSG